MKVCWECDTTDHDLTNPVLEYLDINGEVSASVCLRCLEKEKEYEEDSSSSC